MATEVLEGVTVTAFRWENDTETYTNVGSDVTNELGEYNITGLHRARSYKVKYDQPGYITTYYGSASGSQYDLETGSPTYMATDLVYDTFIDSGGSISGTVEGDV